MRAAVAGALPGRVGMSGCSPHCSILQHVGLLTCMCLVAVILLIKSFSNPLLPDRCFQLMAMSRAYLHNILPANS